MKKRENSIFNQKISHEQWLKILKVVLFTMIPLVILEIITTSLGDMTFITEWIEEGNGNKWIIFGIIAGIMFIQCNLLPIPGLAVLTAMFGIGIFDKSLGIRFFADPMSWFYILAIIVGYMCGATLNYWLGRKFGTKACRWVADSDEQLQHWYDFFNKPKAKIIYTATVIFPCFPDDLLTLIAGSLKMDFLFYTVVNFFGRLIGLITTIALLALGGKMSSGGFPFLLVAYSIVLIGAIILYFVLKNKWKEEIRKKEK